MPYLIIVSLVWAVSFGLIKDSLAGLDTTALGAVRVGLALIVFLPFWRPGKISIRDALRCMGIGGIEFGLMYVLYMAAFKYLAAYQVALFTILTPLWLAALETGSLRRMPLKLAIATLLAIAGAAITCWKTITPTGHLLVGFLLVQGSNLCFAFGQFAYRRMRLRTPDFPDKKKSDASLFAYLYLGAFIVTMFVSTITTDWHAFRPTGTQWLVLVYLGVVASGLCFFWWNIGATRVGTPALAAFNNMKIPLGVACSLLLFGETANIPRLLAGGTLLICAVLISEKRIISS